MHRSGSEEQLFARTGRAAAGCSSPIRRKVLTRDDIMAAAPAESRRFRPVDRFAHRAPAGASSTRKASLSHTRRRATASIRLGSAWNRLEQGRSVAGVLGSANHCSVRARRTFMAMTVSTWMRSLTYDQRNGGDGEQAVPCV